MLQYAINHLVFMQTFSISFSLLLLKFQNQHWNWLMQLKMLIANLMCIAQ